MYNITHDEYRYIDIYIHNLSYKILILNNKLIVYVKLIKITIDVYENIYHIPF